MHIFYDPAIPLPIEIHARMHQKTCTPKFIAVSFTIDKNWEQPKCPSKVGCIHDCGIFIKRNSMHEGNEQTSSVSNNVDESFTNVMLS